MIFRKGLPYFIAGKVVKGFGRGSKELRIPTANFPEEIVEKLPPEIDTGIYYGWASVNGGPVYKMVMSVGWNPFYANEKKSMEIHIIHQMNDFYGATLSVGVLGYIRPEESFKSLDNLIAAIRGDIQLAEELLNQPENLRFKNHPFFQAA